MQQPPAYAASMLSDLDLALSAAAAGAEIVRSAFGGAQNHERKGKFDPVTTTDLASEQAILSLLREHRPDDLVLAEESGGTRTTGRTWIVDPLDGTVNFVHGIPEVAVSVALYDADGGVVGVVHDVCRDEVFAAERNAGATLDGEPLSVSATETIEHAVVATGFPYDHDQRADDLAALMREALKRVNGIRRLGAAALDLAWVAAGRYDGYFEMGIAPWDGAAGHLLVRESGGQVTDPDGVPSDPFMALVVASNGHIHADLLSFVGPIGPRFR